MPNKKNGLGISKFPNPFICNVLLLYANSLWITENRPQNFRSLDGDSEGVHRRCLPLMAAKVTNLFDTTKE